MSAKSVLNVIDVTEKDIKNDCVI